MLVPRATRTHSPKPCATPTLERFSPEAIRAHASNFSTEVFKRRFVSEVKRLGAAPGSSAVSWGYGAPEREPSDYGSARAARELEQ